MPTRVELTCGSTVLSLSTTSAVTAKCGPYEFSISIGGVERMVDVIDIDTEGYEPEVNYEAVSRRTLRNWPPR